jgi:FkbM family methyltransferase
MNQDGQPRPVKLLILDLTPIGSLSATGQLKAELFRDWPPDRLLQVAWSSSSQLILVSSAQEASTAADKIVRRCVDFAPDVIYCRPLDEPRLFRETVKLVLAALPDVPVVTHIMDDWPRRLQLRDPAEAALAEAELSQLLRRSTFRFTIGDRMAEAFQQRYGVAFEPFANCVSPTVWERVEPDRAVLQGEPSDEAPFVIRYSGALADDMTRASVYDVAMAVDRIAAEIPVRLELSVLPAWRAKATQDLRDLAAVSVRSATESTHDYRSFIAGADACLIAYNFDRMTADYVGLSVANKLPDYLAAGRPVLAYGPPNLATIEICQASGAAEVVPQRDASQLEDAIRRLAVDSPRRQSMGERGRDFIFSVADADVVRKRFQERLREAAQSSVDGGAPRDADLVRRSREQACVLSEASVVATLLNDWPRDSIMIDVGAHHGSELKPFVERGWRAYAFEPDPVNRADLERRFGQHPRVVIDPRAVSEVDRIDVPFFRSEQSTGISTLAPFHATHYESDRVSTVRLDRFCKERRIDRIDYLKVDTEGHDLFVLRSLDWEKLSPAAIQVEFEDAKTVPLGYDFHALAEYLVARGFDVWVSEWHPVVAYGRRHDWARLAHYPTELSNKNAWGNLLAFKQCVNESTMRGAVELAISSATEGGNGASSSSSGDPMPSSTVTSGAGLTLSPSSQSARPGAAAGGRLSQFVAAYQGMLALPAMIIGLLYVAALGSALALSGRNNWVPVALLAIAGLLTLGAIGVAIVRTRRERERSASGLIRRLEQAGVAASARADATETLVRDQVSQLRREVESLSGRLESFDYATLRQDLARLDDAQERERREVRDALNATADRVAAVQQQVAATPAAAPAAAGARLVSDGDLDDLVRDWGPRLGLFVDVPVPRAKRHLEYMAEAVRVAEENSIGRLATSTQDMLLRMVVGRAAARDASSRGETLHLLEIGTLFGLGLGLLGYACRGQVDEGTTLTAVDPLYGYYESGRQDISTGESVDVEAFRRNMSGFPLDAEAWRIIQMTNREARAEGSVADRSYGLVVIDGDHSFDEIQYDFEEYRALMARGCYVIFDDYGSEHWPDVAKYVDQKVLPRDDVQFVGSAWRTAVVRVL